MNRKTMRKLPMMLMCAAALAATNPAMPAYAKKKTQVTRSATSDTERMRDAASSVQKAFDKKSLTDLAKLCEYPVTVFYNDGQAVEYKNQNEFKKLGEDVIFSAKMREYIGATNAAKLKIEKNGPTVMGDEFGLTLRKRNGKWRVNYFYVDSAYSSDLSDPAKVAETIQKTLYYKDLETLSQLCDYPLDIFFEDDSYKEVKSAAELKNLGEDRVCTGGLIDAVDQADPSNLPTLGENGLKIGGAKGVDMYKIGNSWKIRAIYQ